MSRGFSTLEILLALTIMTTTLSAIMLLELGAPNALADGAKEIAATSAGAALLDSAFEEGLLNFPGVVSMASTTSTGITVSLNVTSLPDGFTDYLTSSVAWMDVEGNKRFLSLHAFITDFADVLQNPCSDVLTGDWTHPQTHTFTFTAGDLLPIGSELANLVSVLAVSSTTLVGGVGTTSTKTDPTLFIFDISSSTQPLYKGSIDNASSTRQGVNAVALSGNYLFSASANKSNFGTCKKGPSCAQLQVFDISNSSTPVDVENFELATSSAPFALGSGGQSIGKSIVYANGYIYLGLTKSGAANGDEFNIIDVRNPQTPVWVGGFSIGRSINQIVVRGTRAYLATDDSTRELMVFDIHDPANIALVGTYDAPGATGFGYGSSLAFEGDSVALGRTYTPNGLGLVLLSVASDTPQLVSTEAIASTLNPTSVQSVLVRDFLLFVLTNSSLQLFDIHNPAQPTAYGNPVFLPAGSIGTAMTCRDNTVYVTSVGANQTGYLTTLTGS